MSDDPIEPAILVRRQGRIGRLTLNRPRTLNALTHEMVGLVMRALLMWRDDPAVHAVVLDAAGGRAFCAGGDVRHLRQLAIDGAFETIERFFAEEYALNLLIARYPKPYVSLIDGICMGGGIGLSVHGNVRVATEAAQFAMPETAIGMFPDVGGSFILPRLRGEYGMYLGLSGARVDGTAAAWLGLATHLVDRADLPDLVDAMAEDGVAVLASAAHPPAPSRLPQAGIEAFGLGSVAAIMEALGRQESDWSRETLASMHQVSPTALHWTFDILRRGAAQTLEQCQAAELALTRTAMRHPDFSEGVRAMLVDKDRAPRWAMVQSQAGRSDPSGCDGQA